MEALPVNRRQVIPHLPARLRPAQTAPVHLPLADAVHPAPAIKAKASMPIKKYLFAGLLVWLPLAITVWVLAWLFDALDGIFMGLLSAVTSVVPDTNSSQGFLSALRGFHGLGVLLLVVMVLATGALASNVAGRWWVRQWDRLFNNIPIFKSIYASVKKVSDTLFSSNGNAFRKAVLVQYPREGSWTIAFQTGTPVGEVAQHLGNDLISLYVPTTPNPTSGFFIMVATNEVYELEMSVDQALTYVISMGAVAPEKQLPATDSSKTN
jgi:uncharacterized membrane protein